MEWHRDWYVSDGPEKHTKQLFLGPGGEWRLTTSEKKRILLNGVFGVDIDSQAVETTKLSLLLKVLEGETHETIDAQLTFLRERALPDLGANIMCGNSLVGLDFYNSGQMGFLDGDQQLRVNPFDWGEDSRGRWRTAASTWFSATHRTSSANTTTHTSRAICSIITPSPAASTNLQALRSKRGLGLTKPDGFFGMIIPDAVLARDEACATRDLLLSAGLERVYHCGLVFGSAVSAVVLLARRGSAPPRIVSEIAANSHPVMEHDCARSRFVKDPLRRLLVHSSDEEQEMLDRIAEASLSVADIGEISRGEEVGKKNVWDEGEVPILVGDDISRFGLREPTRYIDDVTKSARIYDAGKIVIVKTGRHCIAAVDTVGHVTMQSVYNLRLTSDGIEPEAVVGVLNSSFTDFFIAKTFTLYKLLFPQMNQSTVQSIPIPLGLPQRQGDLVVLVRRLAELVDLLPTVGIPHDREVIDREIAALKDQVDVVVCDLLGLSHRDVALVHRFTSSS